MSQNKSQQNKSQQQTKKKSQYEKAPTDVTLEYNAKNAEQKPVRQLYFTALTYSIARKMHKTARGGSLSAKRAKYVNRMLKQGGSDELLNKAKETMKELNQEGKIGDKAKELIDEVEKKYRKAGGGAVGGGAKSRISSMDEFDV